jgi:predicted kinase
MDFAHAIELIENQLSVPVYRAIKPVLVVMVGLPGSGKSTLARAIAPALPAVVVESDMVRKTLFNPPTHSGQESQLVHRVAHAVIRRLLRRGIPVVSDATNLIEFHREFLYQIAQQSEAALLLVHVVAPEDAIRQRLEQRQVNRSPQDLSDATWEIYQRMQKAQEAIRRPYLTVSTDGDLQQAVRKVVRAARQCAA